MRNRSLRRAAGIGLVALGCAAGSPPEDHFYRLALDPGAAPRLEQPRLAGVLEVERFRADGLGRQRGIVFSEGGDRLRQHRYHHWVEPPVDMIQEELVAYLLAGNVARTVVTPEIRMRPDFRVLGRVLRFERVLDQGPRAVRVEMRLSLISVDDHDAACAMLWTDTYRSQVEAEGGAVADAVGAFRRALEQVFSGFAADVPSAEPPRECRVQRR